MRPCDCESLLQLRTGLNEQGIAFNNYSFTANGTSAIIEISPYVRISIPREKMKAFAEWYLENQVPQGL